MDGRKSSMFRKSADRALIGEVNYSLRFCPVCNLPESRRCSRSTRSRHDRRRALPVAAE